MSPLWTSLTRLMFGGDRPSKPPTILISELQGGEGGRGLLSGSGNYLLEFSSSYRGLWIHLVIWVLVPALMVGCSSLVGGSLVLSYLSLWLCSSCYSVVFPIDCQLLIRKLTPRTIGSIKEPILETWLKIDSSQRRYWKITICKGTG